jgi:hypothetical protein
MGKTQEIILSACGQCIPFFVRARGERDPRCCDKRYNSFVGQETETGRCGYFVGETRCLASLRKGNKNGHARNIRKARKILAAIPEEA